jgi:thymidylate synthase
VKELEPRLIHWERVSKESDWKLREDSHIKILNKKGRNILKKVDGKDKVEH